MATFTLLCSSRRSHAYATPSSHRHYKYNQGNGINALYQFRTELKVYDVKLLV